MESSDSKERPGHSVGLAVMGGVVGVYAFLDDFVVGPIVVGLSAWLPSLIVFAGTAAALTFVNIACCTWLEHQWDGWIAINGERFEARLERMRSSRIMKHPVEWITRGSVVWFTLAALFLGAVIVVAVARFVGGEPIDGRRIRLASIAYSIGFAALYSAVGFGLGDAISAA